MGHGTPRRELVRALREQRCQVIGAGAEHTSYRCPCGRHACPVPGHREISTEVVQAITRRLACLPDGWLR